MQKARLSNLTNPRFKHSSGLSRESRGRVRERFRPIRAKIGGNVRAPLTDFFAKPVQFVNDVLRQPHEEHHEKGKMKGNEFKDEEYLDDEGEAFEIERMHGHLLSFAFAGLRLLQISKGDAFLIAERK
jgi:hypothetical protein